MTPSMIIAARVCITEWGDGHEAHRGEVLLAAVEILHPRQAVLEVGALSFSSPPTWKRMGTRPPAPGPTPGPRAMWLGEWVSGLGSDSRALGSEAYGFGGRLLARSKSTRGT